MKILFLNGFGHQYNCIWILNDEMLSKYQIVIWMVSGFKGFIHTIAAPTARPAKPIC